jgi:hypothetical protein
MKQKWHKEIKAWADGAEIEVLSNNDTWGVQKNPTFAKECEYRIKPPQHCCCDKQTCSALKEPQYLYVYFNKNNSKVELDTNECDLDFLEYVGKIKLEEE